MNENMTNNLGDMSGQGQATPFQQPQQFQPQVAPAYQAPQTPVIPLNCDSAMGITSLTDLQSYSAGVVLRFPDFAEGQPLVARVRRPSLLALAKSGKIPNSLLSSAGDLFSGGGSASKGASENTLQEMYDVCRIVCDACLKSPTVAEIEAAGLELTDEQIMAIFNYSQVGIKALDSFRKEQADT